MKDISKKEKEMELELMYMLKKKDKKRILYQTTDMKENGKKIINME